MDDQMMELMAGDERLRRRLEAYADLRLSPDLTSTSRVRARVLAVAHRHAALARADAALTVLSRPIGSADAGPSDDFGRDARAARGAQALSPRPRHGTRKRAAGVVFAASLGAAMLVGGASAAQPGGALYHTRLWAETLTLPSDPSAHAVAELNRLQERLQEIGAASRSGDTAGAMAALAAYGAILDEASAAAILAGDVVAAAVLETGVGRNVEVLRALANTVPANASEAITRAVDAAIARSADAVNRIGASHPGGGPGHDAGSGPATPPRATKAPTAQPAPARPSTPKPRSTHKVTPQPTVTPEPTATPEPEGTPERTAKPKTIQGEAEPVGSTDPQSGQDPPVPDDPS